MSGICRTITGDNVAAAAVDLFAKCSLEAMLYGPWKSSANVNLLSQVKIAHQVHVTVHLKTDGQRLEFGGCSQYRVLKSLDYMSDAWLALVLPQMRLRYDPTINKLASLRFKPDFLPSAIRRTYLRVQDLLLSEADTFASQVHHHAFTNVAHRDNMDVLNGNTQEFLNQGGFNGSEFDSVGLSRTLMVRLPVFSNASGSIGRSFVTGAAVFNDVRLEVELNDLSDILEIHNGACGTADLVGNPNGRAATFADVETCEGGCPEVISSHILVNGAVGTPDEKKALARMVSTQALKLYSYTCSETFNPYGDSVMTLRLSLGLVGIYFAVVNVTHSRASCNYSTLPGGLGASPWSCAELRYENTVRHTTTPENSILSSISANSTDSNQLAYMGFIPFSFDVSSPHITSSLQASRVSDLVLHVTASPEATQAADGFDHNGNPIAVAEGHPACSGGVQASTAPGQKQRFVLTAVAAQVATVKHVRAAVQMVV